MSFYRLQDADRDATELLDPAQQWSEQWGGFGDPKRGVSVCGNEDQLADYFAARVECGYDADFLATLVIVELDGDLSDEADDDHAEGALLIFPTRIVSVRPVPADMIAAICG